MANGIDELCPPDGEGIGSCTGSEMEHLKCTGRWGEVPSAKSCPSKILWDCLIWWLLIFSCFFVLIDVVVGLVCCWLFSQ